ncbi:MAG TPA: T9SS type A sorting domain-containing protein, partial [Flavobacteriales bacterium]|nr:T9SS type A sorting domain-containing protein [Flavobacteriales bacterium]
DDAGEIDCSVDFSHDKEPHSGSGSALGMPQMEIEWNDTTDWWENIIPSAYKDFSGFKHLQFRCGVNFNTSLSGNDVDFTVELTDVFNATAGVNVQDYTNALYFPPGSHFLCIPKVMFNSVKIPLVEFTGIDLSQIQKVAFRFNNADGALLIAELCVTGVADPVTTGIPPEGLSAHVTVYPNPAENTIYINLGMYYEKASALFLHDVQGKRIYTKHVFTDRLTSINLEGLSQGVYVLSVKLDQHFLRYKIIKQ